MKVPQFVLNCSLLAGTLSVSGVCPGGRHSFSSAALEPAGLFNVGNKLLVKRCIAGPGQWVDMDEAGIVSLDGTVLEEPYLQAHAPGAYDLAFPCQVPEGRWFCMGDHRATSLDSRHSAVGCVAQEQMVGKIVFRVWPLSQFGKLN